MDNKTNYNNTNKGFAFETEAGPFFPFEFPNAFACCGSPLALNSSVEPVVGSTETESDEEDYLVGLTTRMLIPCCVMKRNLLLLILLPTTIKTWAIAGIPAINIVGS
uniref:Uncharacterized protein n=1 Tax=Nelumbo nucifera TaxID=4432 RepID=A0A822YQC1_NELNU|nr:TPA_asm: hypothetical protein HUJ06_007015 [Nelumbo nucifera]